MEQSLSTQPEIFGYACLFGVVLGIYYDVFRVIRLVTVCERRHVFFQDVFYMVTCGGLTFLFAFAANYGDVRFYMLAGEAIGWCVYHLTLGALTVRCTALVVRLLEIVAGWLKRFLFLPIGRFLRFLLRLISIPFQKLGAVLKKSAANSKIHLKRHSKVVYNSFKRLTHKPKPTPEPPKQILQKPPIKPLTKGRPYR